MSAWGIWCQPPKGSNENGGWLRDANGPRPVRIVFTTRAEAEKECDVMVGAFSDRTRRWKYEPRRILEKSKPKKRKAKRR